MGGALFVVVVAGLFSFIPLIVAGYLGADSAQMRFGLQEKLEARRWRPSHLVRIPAVVAVWLTVVTAATYCVAMWRFGWLALPVLVTLGCFVCYEVSLASGRLDYR